MKCKACGETAGSGHTAGSRFFCNKCVEGNDEATKRADELADEVMPGWRERAHSTFDSWMRPYDGWGRK